MTKLKAVCGCKYILESNAVITPTEVIRDAEAHAELHNHAIILQGFIDRPRGKEWKRPIEHTRVRQGEGRLHG
jgi:hypothetical protein